MAADTSPARRRLSPARLRPSGRRRNRGGVYVLIETTQHWTLIDGEWCRDAWVQTPAGIVELLPISQGAVA